MNDETTEYPISTDHLHKGSRVSVEAIERAFGVRRGTDAYRLKMLRVRDYVARRLADRGELVTVIQDGNEIAILTDEEALAYNAHRFEVETRQRDRCFVRLGQTDRANLSEESRGKLDRKIVELGHRVQADRRTRREFSVKAIARSTPAELPKPRKP